MKLLKKLGEDVSDSDKAEENNSAEIMNDEE